MALATHQLDPEIQLAGRPTTFDYYKSAPPTTPWVDAVVRSVDHKFGTLTVVSNKSDPVTLRFSIEDRTDLLRHKTGDVIRVNVRHEGGALKVRHIDLKP